VVVPRLCAARPKLNGEQGAQPDARPPADRLRGFRIRVAWQPPTDPQHFTGSSICYDNPGAQGVGASEYACAGGGIAGRYISVQIYDRHE